MADIYAHCATPKAAKSARFSLFGWFLHLQAVRRQRRCLARLDATQLKDVGLTPSDVQLELQRRLWDAPQHWLK